MNEVWNKVESLSRNQLKGCEGTGGFWVLLWYSCRIQQFPQVGAPVAACNLALDAEACPFLTATWARSVDLGVTPFASPLGLGLCLIGTTPLGEGDAGQS